MLHVTNHVDVCNNRSKTFDCFKVWYFNISSYFVTHIVSHNVRDISNWIPLLWAKILVQRGLFCKSDLIHKESLQILLAYNFQSCFRDDVRKSVDKFLSCYLQSMCNLLEKSIFVFQCLNLNQRPFIHLLANKALQCLKIRD